MNLRQFSRLFSVLMIVALACQFSSAFTYRVEPLNNTIQWDEAAVFRLTIENTLNVEDYFTISTRDVNWILSSEPASGAVAANSQAEFIVKLIPKPTLVYGNVYIAPVKIKSEKTQTYQEEGKKFAILLGTGGPGVYVATVTPNLYIDKVVDPREPVSVRVNLRNRNARQLNGLEVVLKGGTEIEKSYITNLLPLEEKVNEILFRIDPYTLPGKRTLSLRLVFDNETVADSSTEYEVLGFVDMQEKSSTKHSLFRTERVFEIYNNGNEAGTAQHAFSMNLFQRLFTSFEPEAVKERDSEGMSQYVVKKEIGSRETLAVYAVTDYRLLVLFITLAVVAVVLYFIFRSPVIIYKSAEPTGKKATSEGLSEIKVRLYLKNRSNRQIANIRVTDVVPTIADLKKSPHVGSMDPINVSSGRKGTIARWEFASLEPYEERVIAYKIESKLKLVGGIRLPSAKIRFDEKKGKERVTYSNTVNLVHRVEEPEDEDSMPKKRK